MLFFSFPLQCNQCTGAINLATYTILASDRTAIMLVSAQNHLSFTREMRTACCSLPSALARCFVSTQLVLYTLITTLCMLYVDYRGWRLKL